MSKRASWRARWSRPRRHEQYDRAAEHAAEYKAVQQRDVVAGIMQARCRGARS